MSQLQQDTPDPASRSSARRSGSVPSRAVFDPSKTMKPLSVLRKQKASEQESGIRDVLKLWIHPGSLMLCIVILVELYIVLTHLAEDGYMLIPLLVVASLFAGIGIKDIISGIASMKGLPNQHNQHASERDKDSTS